MGFKRLAWSLSRVSVAACAVALFVSSGAANAANQYDEWFESASAQDRYTHMLDGTNPALLDSEAELNHGTSVADEVAEELATLSTDAGAETEIGVALEGAAVAIPTTAVTVVATAMVVVAGHYFYKRFFGDVGSVSATNITDHFWNYYPSGSGTYQGVIPSGPHWVLRYAAQGGNGLVERFTPCNTMSCAGWDSTQLQTNVSGWAWQGAGVKPVGTNAYPGSPYCGNYVGTCFVKWITPAQLTAAMKALGATGWISNGTSGACPPGSAICVTLPPLVTPTPSTPATTTEVEHAPAEVKYWIYNTILQNDPQPGDPAAPGDPVTDPNWNEPVCDVKPNWPHESIGTPGAVDAKSQVACSYATTVPLTTTLWKCDEEPQPDRARLTNGEWGCSQAAQNTEVVAVPGGMTAWSEEVMAPKADTIFIAPDNKWFISSAMGPYATPEERFSPARQLP
jgi:hypothetical protein